MPPYAEAPTSPRPSRSTTGWVALATLMLATLLPTVASVCLYPQVVTLSTEFDQPVSTVVWTMVAFGVVATGVGGVAAALGAVIGNRRMLMIALVALLAGSLLAALSTSLSVLIAARALQGIGMAGQVLAIGIVAAYWRGEGMRRAISMIVFAMGLGGLLAYVGAGVIWKGGGDWRILFWILGGVTALDLVLTMAFVRETKRTKGVPIDYVGCVGLVAWAVLVLVPLSQANSWGWGSGRTLGLLLPGLVLVTLWVLWELSRSAPLVDLHLLRRPGVWQGAVTFFAVSIALCVPSTAMPYLFQTPASSGFGFGKSLFTLSLALALPALVMMLSSPLTTPLMRRLGAKRTMLLGLMFGLSGFGLAFVHGSIGITLAWMAATGVMSAWTTAASLSVGTEAVPPRQGVIVSTIFNTAAGGGSAIAAAVVGYVLTLRSVSVEVPGPDGPVFESFPAEETISWSALIVGSVALAAALCVLTVRGKRLRVVGRGVDQAE